MRNRAKKNQFWARGATLIELVIYLTIFASMSIFITFGIAQISAVFSKVRVERKVSLAAESAMERITRELALASDVSCLTTPPTPCPNVVATNGTLIQLNSYPDFLESSHDNPVTKELKLSGTQIMFDNNTGDGTPAIELSPYDVSIQSLAFKKLADPTSGHAYSKAVRVELTATGGAGKYQVTSKYYATAILKNSY